MERGNRLSFLEMILVIKRFIVLFCFLKKLVVFFGPRVEGTVLKGFADGMPLLKEVKCGRRKIGMGQSFVDVADGLLGRVVHVFLIEAVVTELIVDNLVGREIDDRRVVKRFDDLVDSQQQRGLGQLTAMITIFSVADRTHGEQNTRGRKARANQSDSLRKCLGTLVDSQLLFVEKLLRPLLAVVHDLTRGDETIDMIGAEREDSSTGFVSTEWQLTGIDKPPDRMEHAHRIVHHTERIDKRAEFLFLEPLADVVGKARSHEEHPLAGLNLPRRGRNGDGCGELQGWVSYRILFSDFAFSNIAFRNRGVYPSLLWATFSGVPLEST